MGFNQVTGVYTPAAGAESAAPGQVVQSAVWDAIFTDMSGSFTEAMQALQNTYGQRNIIGANGGFEVWQRGAGGTASIAVSASSSVYTADRWYLTTNANQACTVAQVAGIVTGSQWAAKPQRNSGQTGTGFITFGFPFDVDECAMLAGQIVAVSFTAKAGANWSPASGTLNVYINAGTGSPAKTTTGYSNQTQPLNSSANLTTTATRYTFISAAIAANATQLEVGVNWAPVGTAGTDDSLTIDDFQVEIIQNTSAPIAAFERWPFERSLLACKRHYRKSFPYKTAPAQNAGLPGASALVAAAGAACGLWIQHYPIELRATASYTSYNPSGSSANAQNITTGSSLVVSLDSAGINSPVANMIYVSVGSTSIAAGNQIAVHWQADAGI
jgi:hypothetical protein